MFSYLTGNSILIDFLPFVLTDSVHIHANSYTLLSQHSRLSIRSASLPGRDCSSTYRWQKADEIHLGVMSSGVGQGLGAAGGVVIILYIVIIIYMSATHYPHCKWGAKVGHQNRLRHLFSLALMHVNHNLLVISVSPPPPQHSPMQRSGTFALITFYTSPFTQAFLG